MIPIAPSNSIKSPYVQPRLEQGSPDLSTSRAYNLSSAYANEMKLLEMKIYPVSFNMIWVSYDFNWVPIFSEFLLLSVQFWLDVG